MQINYFLLEKVSYLFHFVPDSERLYVSPQISLPWSGVTWELWVWYSQVHQLPAEQRNSTIGFTVMFFYLSYSDTSITLWCYLVLSLWNSHCSDQSC